MPAKPHPLIIQMASDVASIKDAVFGEGTAPGLLSKVDANTERLVKLETREVRNTSGRVATVVSAVVAGVIAGIAAIFNRGS